MIKLVASSFYNDTETQRRLAEFVAHTKQFSFGDECRKFQSSFALWQGRRHAVLCNSGSSANLALIQALVNLGRLKRGDIVAFSAVTWSTNVMPLIQHGLSALPLDVSAETLNVTPVEVERAIAAGAKTIFLTNLLGFCDDIAKIQESCEKSGTILLEDNCESLGSVSAGKKLGNFGLASTFSFFIGHHLSTIEGGMVCTDDEELATALTIVRAHGWDRQLDEKHQDALRAQHGIDTFYGLYTFYDLGYNLRPMEINGFLGNEAIQYVNEIVEKREKVFKTLSQALHGKEGLYMPFKYSHMDISSAMVMPLVCVSEEVRTRVIEKASGKVEIRPLVAGSMLLQPFFEKWQPHMAREAKCPVAEMVHARGLYAPLYPQMTEEDIASVLDVFSQV